LGDLQRLITRPPADSADQAAMTRRLPPELTGGQELDLGLVREEVTVFERVKAALRTDLRFEHLRDVDNAVWHFVGECWADRGTDHVAAFIERHGRQPMARLCYFPIEFLSVVSEMEVFGIHLLPVNDPKVPQTRTWFKREAPVGSVAAVRVRGTSFERMADRARLVATHALRVLRVALREHRGITDEQLRFRLGIAFAFDNEESAGWRQRDDVAYDLELTSDLMNLARGQPISALPLNPTTDVERKADLALRWMERAWLTGEPLVGLLFLFFALEALLGDKSEGLKAHLLASRQIMLSHILTGGFSHPNETWFLYEKVRSGAVHGENAPEVSRDMVQSFAWVVRRTLNQYLTLAQRQGLVKRGRLLKMLDAHPDRPQLIAWLRHNGGSVWTEYLDKIEHDSHGAVREGRNRLSKAETPAPLG
jgi:hypothetical protein